MKRLALFVSIAAGIIFPGSSQAAFFQGLGHLPGGNFPSVAWSVSADGLVVVRECVSESGYEAFRWTSDSGMVGLGYVPGSSDSYAYDLSSAGSVIVGYNTMATGFEAFRWTSIGGMLGLGHLPGGYFPSVARGVSADGLVVVGYSGYSTTESGFEAFRWTSVDGMVGLGDLPGGNFNSQALAVSYNGSVVVGHGRSASGREAFRWTTGGGMVGLGDLPGGNFYSVAYGVSADGSVVVGRGFSSSGTEAFRWTSNDGMVGLGHLPGGGLFSIANGVSADGSVVVGYSDSATGDEPFIWDSTNGMQSLRDVLTSYGIDLTGWSLFSANDISDDGKTIVGYGFNPDGNREAWIANLHIDTDGDGIPDDDDACPFSDLSETVVIDGCDSDVDNVLLEDGCTISDLISKCADNAKNHRKFVRCVSHLLRDLKKQKIITRKEKRAVRRCAVKTNIP
jgi:probable HAF family extracellular repeat protein